MSSLSDVIVTLTVQTGDLIECLSNSLGLTTKATTEGAPPIKLGSPMAKALTDFVFELLRLCKPAEHMITAAQLVDQVMIIIMKTMVFARHRIYLKLRVFMMFIELHGLKEFCQQLQYMWDWAVTIPAVEAAALDKASDAAKPADPNAGLQQIMNNALESMLSILSFIVDGEPLMESPELPALCKGHEEQQCWFRMSDFMVEVRLQALPALQHIWESQLLFTGSNNLMMAFMSCLAPVLNAQHETRTNSSRMGFRAHFPGLVERRRVGQPAAASAGAAGRGSGAQTPIPMLGRALGAVERSSPLAQTPIQPLSAESLEMETQQSNNDTPEATPSVIAAPAGPSNDQSQGNDRSSEGDFATHMSIDSVESPVVPPASVDNAEATAVAITEAEAGEPSVAPTGIEPYNLPSWREAKDAEETAERERLKKIRGALRDNITPRVIAVVDEFKSKAVVQVKSALELVLQMGDSLADINMLMNAFKPLLDFASNMAGDAASGDLDERLAAHAYLWAVVLSSSVLLENIYPHMGLLSPHILRALEAAARREGRSPPWLTALLLVAEQLLQRDMRPAKVKLESKEEFQRIAKRGLTKLPPSKEPIDPSVAPAESSVSREAEAIRSMFAQPLLQRLQPQGSAFEQILLGHDEEEEEEEGDDLSGDDAQAQPGQQTTSVAGPAEPASSSADASKPQASPPDPVFSIEQRFELQRIATLFFAAPVPEFSGSALNALMRLIVILTRDPQFAVEFLDSGALASVVRTMRTMSTGELPSIKATAKERTPLGFVNALMNVNKEQRQEQRQERSLIMHILRHVVESRPVLRLVMENLIQGWFESSQYSSTDVNSFARATLPYALRNVDLFTDVASERCFLPNYNEEMRVSWMVLAWRSAKLLDEEEVDKYEASSKSGEEFLEYLNGKKEQPSFEPYEMDAESERLACRVAEFLCDEILSLRTAQAINSSASTTMLQSLAAAVAPTTKARVPPSIAPATSSAEDSPDAIAYRVFLMQCLSEMIASFPFTLRAIFVARSSTAQASVLTPRREKPKDKGKGVAATGPTQDEGQASPPQKIDMRVRSPLISYLVHDLVVREAVTNAQARRLKNKAAETEGTELDQIMAIAKHQIAFKQGQLSNSVTFWASALLSTVCVRHQQGWSTTRPKASAPATDQIHTLDLECLVGNYDMSVFAARHMVLDHIVRAFRECLSTTAAGMGIGGADVIYARLTSLAQLVHKLVIARPISHGRSQDSHGSETDSSERESSSALRQVILERGVLDLLSAASSRVNLNHPLGREMLGVFLRPIELLSKAAVKISREAVLKAWEESGQEKMPSVAMGQQHRGPGVADMWDDDNALEDSADAGVPPDL
ncbi:E3 ubiquitin-protein ligase tom1, partial [Kickxella alabastrina]